MKRLALLLMLLSPPALSDWSDAPHDLAGLKGIWIDPGEIGALPTSGPAWEAMKKLAGQPAGTPNLSDQEDPVNVRVLARALIFARTGEEKLRREVVESCLAAMGTEKGGRSLALARELGAYVLAADLVGLPPEEEARFKAWLRQVREEPLEGRTLISTQEDRPNNWGTHAAASRIAVALYLKDAVDLDRAARVFKGYLGDRQAYDGFRYGERHWQSDPELPVGVAPRGASKDGHDLDGVLPDDQRRCCKEFTWPPPRENYVYEALQGALAAAVMLSRAGYDVWNWEDKALLRAFSWLHRVAEYPAEKDDTWQPHLINKIYGTTFPAPLPSRPGKNVGFTDWTHAPAP